MLFPSVYFIVYAVECGSRHQSLNWLAFEHSFSPHWLFLTSPVLKVATKDDSLSMDNIVETKSIHSIRTTQSAINMVFPIPSFH